MVHRSRSVSTHHLEVLSNRARRMRHEPTQTEWQLWHQLRAGKQGAVFRRQVVLQGYIVDYYACAVRLVVEVDGPWHERRVAADQRRDRVLAAAGYRVLRVSAEEVVSSLTAVVGRIRAAAGRG